MLPVQKQDASKVTTSKPVSDFGQMGFGKVLTSIQGLQQRLEDFSVEDVARTETNAQALALKLSQLQAKLSGLNELQSLVALVNTRIDAVPEENFDKAEPASLEKYPALAAIVQADALIRRHGLTRPEKPAPTPNTAQSDEFTAPVPVAEFSDQIFVSEFDQSKTGRPTSTSPLESEDWVLSTDTEKDSILSAHSSDFELGTLPGDNASSVAPHSLAAATDKRTEEKPEITSATNKNSGNFDEQLLNELIESYGEFTISSGAAPNTKSLVAKPVTEIKAEPVFAGPAVIIEAKPIAKSIPPKSAPTRSALSPKPVPVQTPATKTTIQLPSGPMDTLPAMVVQAKEVERKALIVPETPKLKKEQREARAKENKLQVASKHGEIDRQLKSIIKDYGEYDLYSPRSKSNFKLAAIGAFAVLGLVLGGLYFFKAPSAPKPAAVSTVEQTDGTKSATPTNKPDQK